MAFVTRRGGAAVAARAAGAHGVESGPWRGQSSGSGGGDGGGDGGLVDRIRASVVDRLILSTVRS